MGWVSGFWFGCGVGFIRCFRWSGPCFARFFIKNPAQSQPSFCGVFVGVTVDRRFAGTGPHGRASLPCLLSQSDRHVPIRQIALVALLTSFGKDRPIK